MMDRREFLQQSLPSLLTNQSQASRNRDDLRMLGLLADSRIGLALGYKDDLREEDVLRTREAMRVILYGNDHERAALYPYEARDVDESLPECGPPMHASEFFPDDTTPEAVVYVDFYVNKAVCDQRRARFKRAREHFARLSSLAHELEHLRKSDLKPEEVLLLVGHQVFPSGEGLPVDDWLAAESERVHQLALEAFKAYEAFSEASGNAPPDISR